MRLIDLLHVAVDDMRQGGDPRLPLELALVKVTRPGGRPLARVARLPVERLEEAGRLRRQPERPEAPPSGATSRTPAADAEPTSRNRAAVLELEQLQEAWRRTVLPAVEERSIPTAAMLAEAHPAALDGDALTLEFPPRPSFHRRRPRTRRTRRCSRRRSTR